MGNTGSSSKQGLATKRTSFHHAQERLGETVGDVKEEFHGLAVNAGGDDRTVYVPTEAFLERCAAGLGARGRNISSRLHAVLDIDGDGLIDYEEYVSAAYLLRSSTPAEKLKLLFDMYDGAGSGFMSNEDLQDLLLDMTSTSTSTPRLAGRGSFGHGGGGDGAAAAAATSASPEDDGSGESHPPGDPDLDLYALQDVICVMADSVLYQHDLDLDGKLSEKEWNEYVKSDEDEVYRYLNVVCASAAHFLRLL